VPGDATFLKRFFFRDNFVKFIFRRRSKRIAFFGISEFFYLCVYAIFFKFSSFRGLYLLNAWSQTPQTSKRHTYSLGFPSVLLVWGKTVSCSLCAGYSKGTLKREKILFWDLAPPTIQNSGIFHDSTRPHLHSDGLSPKSRRSVVSL